MVQLLRRPHPHQRSIERVFEAVDAHLPERFDVRVVVSSHANSGVLPRLRAMLEARRAAGDLTHVTGDTHYLTVLLPRGRTVLTVHDTEFLDRSGAAKRLLYRWLWLRLPVRRASVVTVPSEATRRDLLAEVRVPPGKVRVVGNPVRPEFAPGPEGPPGGRPVVLLLGTWPAKNLDRSLAALEGLGVDVVVVGPLDDRQRAAVGATGLSVRHVEGLADHEVVALYRSADLLLFPSLKEGFGLPVVEAQACGCPVVTSDRPPLPDASGGAAELVDPLDVGSIRAGVLRVLHDDELRSRLVAEGLRNAARYTPAAVAAQYAAVYDELLGRRGSSGPSLQ